MNSFNVEKISIIDDIIKKNSSTPKFINQNDFIYFKNEILKDLKMIESRIIMKLDASKREFDIKFLNIENKFNSLKSKFLENPISIDLDKNYSEKINNLYLFKTNLEDKLFIQEKKLKEINDYSKESIYSMNRLIQENIACPGIIGKNGKFSSFQNLVDHILSNLNILNAFKDKMVVLDIHNYKTKLDKLVKSFKVEMDTFVTSAKKLTTDSIINFENKGKELFIIFEHKLEEEKNELEKKINNTHKEIEEQHNLINNNKNELMNKINKHILIASDNFSKINSNHEKCLDEIEILSKKNEELNKNIKKISLDLEEKMKEIEHKLIIKMSHLYKMMKDFNEELNKRFKSLIENADGVHYNNFDLNKLFENNINIIRNSEPEIPNIQLKSSHSVGSILKKYIEGEIGLNDFIHSARVHKIKRKSNSGNNLNDSETKNNQFPNNEPNKYINQNNNNDDFQNIKHIKLDKSEIMKNYTDNFKNKFFLNRKNLDKIAINKGNLLLNKVPKKEIIRSLLQGNELPFCFYLMKKKSEKNNKIKSYLNVNSKGNTERIKSPFLSKGKTDLNIFQKKNNKNNSFVFNKKEKKIVFNNGEDSKQISNEEINDFQDVNKRTLSSLNDKSRNNANHSSFTYNNTDIEKNDSKIIKNKILKENKENNKNKTQKNFYSSEAKVYEIKFKSSAMNIKIKDKKNKSVNKLNNIKEKNDKSDINKIIKNKAK